MRQMSEGEAAYMGALVDGEGSVGVYTGMHSKKGHGRVTPLLTVMVCNSDPELISACFRATGTGGCHVRPPGTFKSGDGKWIFRWNIYGFKSLPFLHRIAPYSVKAQRGIFDLAMLYGAPV